MFLQTQTISYQSTARLEIHLLQQQFLYGLNVDNKPVDRDTTFKVKYLSDKGIVAEIPPLPTTLTLFISTSQNSLKSTLGKSLGLTTLPFSFFRQ